MKIKRDVQLWPPNPNPESWNSDVPNEGLVFGSDGSIADMFADYQGFYIICPEQPLVLMFLAPTFAPTKNEEYLQAYRVILEEMDGCWCNPVETTWDQIMTAVVSRLKELGWSEVIEAEGTESYWSKVNED